MDGIRRTRCCPRRSAEARRSPASCSDISIDPEGQVGAPVAELPARTYFALYAQDSWRVIANLTVNYGLRWEYDQPFVDQNDAIVNIDFDWANTRRAGVRAHRDGRSARATPAFRLADDVQTCATDAWRRRLSQRLQRLRAALGIAWTPTPKTVLRTGGAMLLRARHRQRRVRHRPQRAVHDQAR